MTQPCPLCRKTVIKHGPPVLHRGGFLDQILHCPSCGWVGVDTEEVPIDWKPEPVQGSLFED